MNAAFTAQKSFVSTHSPVLDVTALNLRKLYSSLRCSEPLFLLSLGENLFSCSHCLKSCIYPFYCFRTCISLSCWLWWCPVDANSQKTVRGDIDTFWSKQRESVAAELALTPGIAVSSKNTGRLRQACPLHVHSSLVFLSESWYCMWWSILYAKSHDQILMTECMSESWCHIWWVNLNVSSHDRTSLFVSLSEWKARCVGNQVRMQAYRVWAYKVW